MISDVKRYKYQKYCNQLEKYKKSNYIKRILSAGNEIAGFGNRAGDSFLLRVAFLQFARKHINIS